VSADGDAAEGLGMRLIPHAIAMARACAALARVAAGISRAERICALAAFNSEYRRRRLEAGAKPAGS
jgi:hypothetical protein